MKYLIFLFIVISNKNYSQEYIDTIPKYKTNSIGISISSNYTKDGSDYFTENIFGIYAQHNNMYCSLGYSYTNKIDFSSQQTSKLNLMGIAINLGCNLYNYKHKFVIPFSTYYNYYNHSFLGRNHLNSKLYFSSKGIKIGGQYNFNKIHLSPYFNFGLNYIKVTDQYSESNGVTHTHITVALLKCIEIGIKYNFYKSRKIKKIE